MRGQISAPPRLGIKLNEEFIKGMGKQDDKFLIILDIDRILTTEEMDVMQQTGPGSVEYESSSAHAEPESIEAIAAM